MSSLEDHIDRSRHHRQPRPLTSRWEFDDLASEPARAERDEWRAADLHDRTEYVRINGGLYDADRVPHPSEVEDGAW